MDGLAPGAGLNFIELELTLSTLIGMEGAEFGRDLSIVGGS